MIKQHVRSFLVTPALVALFASCTVTPQPTVTPAVSSVQVTPATATVNAGATQAFTATAFDAAGKTLGNVTFTWSSSNPNVASVSAAGVATGVTAGDATITATAEGKSATATLHVQPAANTGSWSGVKQYGTTTQDSGYAIASDAAGSVYAVGSVLGNLHGEQNTGGQDAYLVKFNADGTRAWTRLLGATGGTTTYVEVAYGVATDAAGNAYVTGYTTGTLHGTNAGDADVFLAKYAPDGTRTWVRQLGSPQHEYARAVTVTPAGHVYVVGETRGALDGQAKAVPGSTTDWDAFVTQYDTNGNRAWTRLIGSTSVDKANGVTHDAAGNAYVVGQTGATLDGQTGPSQHGNAFVVKVAPDGSRTWTQLYAGTFASVVMAGNASGAAVVGDEVHVVTPFHLAVLNTGTGALVRDHLFSSTAAYSGRSVSADPAGNVYVGGAFTGTSNGKADAALIKFAPDGSVAWQRSFGSSETDQTFGVTVTSQGAFLVGVTLGNLPGNTNATPNCLGDPMCGMDAFVAGYAPDGTLR